MITIPLYILLFAYLFFLVVFVIFSAINLGHIFQTGGVTFTSFVATAIVLTLTVFTLFFTWFLLKDITWTNTWEIHNWFNEQAPTFF